VRIRGAGPEDAGFLLEVLAHAADWHPGLAVRSRPEVLADDAVARYARGWPKPEDAGVVAELNGRRAGAAWWRYLRGADAGYGFVSDDVPEITLGVLPAYRGQGLGRLLMQRLVEVAAERGVEAISLSVERENFASGLYAALGFREVGGSAEAPTMLLTLTDS
jgi:ribosomal protein S18 acetylase RimI-like enzyme